MIAARLIWRWNGSRACPLAAAGYFAYPSFLLSAPIPQKESLTILLVLIVIRSAMNLSPRPPSWLVLGISWGALALTQPVLLGLPVFLILASRERSQFAFILGPLFKSAFVAAVVMVPWWIRNYILFDQFIPLTTSAGPALFVGATGDHFLLDAVARGASEPERLSAIGGSAIRIIKDSPGYYALEVVRHSAVAFLLEADVVRRITWGMRGGLPTVLLAITLASWWGLLALTLGLRAWRQSPCGSKIILASLTYLAISAIWFEFAERHRYFLIPLLLLVAVPALFQRPPIDRPGHKP
ncbi:MAG TPA: hypothetical protein VNI79_01380 [Sphingomicrobium sp.]|nr:hypothetical protein [Sphingomicrobium sp.]